MLSDTPFRTIPEELFPGIDEVWNRFVSIGYCPHFHQNQNLILHCSPLNFLL